MPNGLSRRNFLQQEQRTRTRALIVDAAQKTFADRGYVGSSIEHILVTAGVSRAAFYSHFDGKLAVVRAIAKDFEPAWHPVFAYLAELRNPGLPELTEWATRHLEMHRANRDICTLLTQVAVLEEALYWEVSAQRDIIITMLAERHKAFELASHDDDVLLEAHILLWGLDQACFHVVRQHLHDPSKRAAEIIAGQMKAFLDKHGG